MKSAGQLIRPNGQVSVAAAIDAELAAELQRRAAEEGTSVSALLRKLIRDELQRTKGMSR
jgi:hypothetical protein